MNEIIKNPPPHNFSKWKNANRRISINYKDIPDIIKCELKESIITEQNYVCCYCGVEVSIENSHIEHHKPKDRFPKMELAYENLLVSCNSKSHCGHKKANWYVENETVSPLAKDCNLKFKYTEDGQIIASNDKDSCTTNTIMNLGLNIAKLNAIRSKIIEGIMYLIEQEENISLEDLIDEYSKPNADGKLYSYNQVIIGVLKDNYNL
ncbi:TIGR02646 family protein [Paenibacillus sp. CFBP13512]|uniref:retron system putative HNH endonuclease n=1 Tax=Paenibacillus sp. CFBP13512 TaxID=2184007 RepID=UPI0010BFA10D|nr:retron system putative HNH endonuclease [Paenibacillus sp. CFBP13512]TKJ93279.1 TIGR02646 family protein [Paenibacillus sp. CFBP13512]